METNKRNFSRDFANKQKKGNSFFVCSQIAIITRKSFAVHQLNAQNMSESLSITAIE